MSPSLSTYLCIEFKITYILRKKSILHFLHELHYWEIFSLNTKLFRHFPSSGWTSELNFNLTIGLWSEIQSWINCKSPVCIFQYYALFMTLLKIAFFLSYWNTITDKGTDNADSRVAFVTEKCGSRKTFFKSSSYSIETLLRWPYPTCGPWDHISNWNLKGCGGGWVVLWLYCQLWFIGQGPGPGGLILTDW